MEDALFADPMGRAAEWLDGHLRPGRAARVACAVVGLALVVAGTRKLLGAMREG